MKEPFDFVGSARCALRLPEGSRVLPRSVRRTARRLRFSVLAALVLLPFACDRSPPTGRAVLTGDSPLVPAFQTAARDFDVPAEILAATAYAETAFLDRSKHWDEPRESSMPRAAGVTGLLEKSRVRSIARAASLAGTTEDAIVHDRLQNARGAAAVLRAIADEMYGKGVLHADGDREAWLAVVARWFDAGAAGDKLALEVRKNIARGLVAHDEDGRTIRIPSFAELMAPAPAKKSFALSGEYPSSTFIAADSQNYTAANRSAADIDMIVIHTTQGSYAGAISWFENPQAQASAHYVIRASDGAITQMVHHADIAWHAGNWSYNTQSIGIEHEGYITDPNWATEVMYESSANLTRWLCDTLGVPKDRAHIIGHVEVPNQTHTDPGMYWDWNHYMALVTSGTMMAANGTLKGVVYIGSDTTKRVPGASVSVMPGGATMRADANGYFQVALAPGQYTVSASAPGYAANDVMRTISSGMDTWGSVSVTPAATGTGVYRGVVYDARHPDLSVKLQNAKVSLSNGMSVTTAADGVFIFTVAPGMYTARAELMGWDPASTMRTVTAGQTSWGSIGLLPTGSMVDKPPQVPDPESPIGGVEVVPARPIFTVVSIADPENDAITLETEIYADAALTNRISEVHVAVPPSTAIASWQHPADDLPRSITLYWRTRANDGTSSSPWTTPQSFVMPDDGLKDPMPSATVLVAQLLPGVGPDQPPTGAAIYDPKDSESVLSTRPSITAGSASDPEGDALSYEFEISEDDVFEGVIARSTPVASQGSFNSWQPDQPLTLSARYYVRARAADARMYGPWSPVVGFTVDPHATTPPSDAGSGTTVHATITRGGGHCDAVGGASGLAPLLLVSVALFAASRARRRT